MGEDGCGMVWGMDGLILAKLSTQCRISSVKMVISNTWHKGGCGIDETWRGGIVVLPRVPFPFPTGNKGGVGISLFFGSMSLGFICTHLTSGNEKCSR